MQEAIESGSIVTKEEYEAARQSRIDDVVRTVNLLKDNGFPLENRV